MLFGICLILSMPVMAVFMKTSFIPAVSYLSISVITCYFIVTFLYLLKATYLRFIFGGILCIVLMMMAAIDCFCISTYGEELNQEYVALIFETNIKETTEFLKRYISFTYIATLAVCITLIAVSLITGRKAYAILNTKLGSWIGRNCKSVSALIAICLIAGVYNISYAKKYPLVRISYFFDYKTYPDLADYYSNPDMIPISDSHPSKVVVIIGESLTRSHCSLYGYGVETNPRLQKLRAQGDLYSFDNVTSLSTKTMRSLKNILSTYREEGTNWWEHLSIIEVLNKCGYTTYWKSNQEKEGIYGVLATQYARLCDDAEFVCDIPGAKGFDEELLSMEYTGNADKTAIIYHLAGSHPAFSARYPATFEGFIKDNYTEIPEHQRHDYATYDTSVLYNDSIVSEIMTRYDNDDAIVIYFPDHGLDFYDTSDTYCGHSRNNPESLKAGRQIPFMVYCSKNYQQRHPDIINALKKNEHTEWCVSETIYTLMKFIGYTVKDDKDIDKYSLI